MKGDRLTEDLLKITSPPLTNRDKICTFHLLRPHLWDEYVIVVVQPQAIW